MAYKYIYCVRIDCCCHDCNVIYICFVRVMDILHLVDTLLLLVTLPPQGTPQHLVDILLHLVVILLHQATLLPVVIPLPLEEVIHHPQVSSCKIVTFTCWTKTDLTQA